MKHHAVFLATLALVVSASSHAKCIERVNIRARVVAVSCVGVTFTASDILEEGGLRLYEKGAKVSGSVLTVEVQTSTPVGPGASPLEKWTKGAWQSLFIAKPPAEACPADIQRELTIVTDRQCCDTWPMNGLCLVPDALIVAKIE